MVFCRKSGKDNLFRCTYVLPDGVTYTKGFVKYPEQACRYLALVDDGVPSEETKGDMNGMEIDEQPKDRQSVDLTKNVLVGFCLI